MLFIDRYYLNVINNRSLTTLFKSIKVPVKRTKIITYAIKIREYEVSDKV